mgnify:CR=1 FL=1
MTVRMLLAMSDTGGGHRAVSNAIQGAVNRLYGSNVEVIISDVFALGPRTIFEAGTRLYSPVLRHAPWLYGLMYHWSENPKVYAEIARQADLMETPRIKAHVAQVKPDIILSIHPLANRPLIRARAALGLQIPILAVVTELVSVHQSWVEPRIDAYVVATPETRSAVLGLGAPPSAVHELGLPVNERFGAVQRTAFDIRRSLDLDPHEFTVLVFGGGEGAGRLGHTMTAINRARLKGQFIVVCGRNRMLKRRLESKFSSANTRILGFVTDMPELMHAADVVVTKGGPQSISEALASRKPVVLTAVTPGQEEGNDTFVERHGVGLAPSSTAGVVEALRTLAANPELRERFSRNAARVSRPEAAANVARLAYEMALAASGSRAGG